MARKTMAELFDEHLISLLESGEVPVTALQAIRMRIKDLQDGGVSPSEASEELTKLAAEYNLKIGPRPPMPDVSMDDDYATG